MDHSINSNQQHPGLEGTSFSPGHLLPGGSASENDQVSSNGERHRRTDSLRGASTDQNSEQNEPAATAELLPTDPGVAKTGVWNVQGDVLCEGSGIDFSVAELPGLAATGEYTPGEINIAVRREGRSFAITDSKIVAEYGQISYVAHGSFGVVCRAIHKQLGCEVAIKILTSDSREVQERFDNEVKITAQLGANSDNIIKVFGSGLMEIKTETGEVRSVPYASMEFIQETLSERVRELHAFREAGDTPAYQAELERLVHQHFKQTCLGIEYAHSQGILHRDIKPANIAISVAELGERTRVIDWGLGKREGYGDADGSVRADYGVRDLMTLYTQAGAVVGSPPYMSPEQALGSPSVDTRSDVYALGATLYEILTKEYPFKGLSGTKVVLGLRDGSIEPAPIEELNPQAPRPLRLIAEKAMHPDPDQRYQSARDIAADVDRYFSGYPVTASESLPVLERARETAQLFLARNKNPLLVAGLLVSSMVPTSVFGLNRYNEYSRAGDRAGAVAAMLDSVQDMPPQDSESAVRQLEKMLLNTKGETHELVLEQVAAVNAELTDRQEFIKYRDAERAKYDHFISEAESVIGSMTFNDKAFDTGPDDTLKSIDELLCTYDIKDNPSWSTQLSEAVFSSEEIAAAKDTAFNLYLAAALRVLPVTHTRGVFPSGGVSTKKQLAERADWYLTAAEAELNGEQSYGLIRLRQLQNAYVNASPVPAVPENLQPVTEIDFFVEGFIHSDTPGMEALRITREGIEKYPRSALLRFSESYYLRIGKLPELALDSLTRAESLLDGETTGSLLGKNKIIEKIIEKTSDDTTAVRLVDELIRTQERLFIRSKDLETGPLRIRFATQRLGVARNIFENIERTEEVQRKIEMLAESGSQELEAAGIEGLSHGSLKTWMMAAVHLSAIGNFERAIDFYKELQRIKELDPVRFDDAFFQEALSYSVDRAYRSMNHNAQAWLVPEYLKLLEDQLSKMNEEEFKNAIVDSKFACMESKFYSNKHPDYASEYGRMVNERAAAIGLAPSEPPILPYVGKVPFNKVVYSTRKGNSQLKKQGLNWFEEISPKEIYQFTQVDADDTFVTLHDRSRNLFLKISAEECFLWRGEEQGWLKLYDVAENPNSSRRLSLR